MALTRRTGLLPALLVGLAVVVAAPPVRAAAPVEFGTPTAESRFGVGLEFRQPVELAASVDRVELLLTFPSAIGPLAIETVVPTRSGQTTLEHRFDLSADGHLLPNTVVEARWRLRASDGASYLGPVVEIRYEDDRFAWQTVAGDIVRVHWYEGSRAFALRALAIGEAAVDETEALLGVTETESIDFYVYADQAAFYDALGPGTRENVVGQANAEIRTLFALIQPDEIDDPWVGVVVPHELVHLVFDTAVSHPYHFPPRWLNEGLASYLSEGYKASDRRTVEAAALDGSLIPLEGLVGQFPTTREGFFLAYAESVSALDHLIQRYGEDAMVDLIRSYQGGVTDDEAFEAAIGVDVATFNADWFAAVGAEVPDPVGPQPDPPGPLPEGWTGSAGPGIPTASATPLPPASGNGGGSDAGIGRWLWPLLLGLLVGAGAGLLVAFARGRRRRVTADPPPTSEHPDP
jgi:hypothetical protein